MAITIQFRRGTLPQWTAANPVLASGEPGIDLTNMLLKVGDGNRNWNNLPYVSIRLSGGTGIGLSQNPDGSYTISSPLSISGIGLSSTYNNSPSGNYTLSLSTGLQSIANLNIPANNYLYTTSRNTFSTGLITPAGRSLLASTGHTHSVSDITNFNSIVSGLIGSSVVYTTGDQTIDGIKTFSNMLNINGTGVSLSGHTHSVSDITGLEILVPNNAVLTTGNQSISGIKVFNNLVEIGSPFNSDPGILNVYTNNSSDIAAQINLKNSSQVNRLSIISNDDSQTSSIESSNTNLELVNRVGEINIFTKDRFTTNISMTGSDTYYQNFSVTDGKVQVGTSFRSGELSVIGSGNFSDSLLVGGSNGLLINDNSISTSTGNNIKIYTASGGGLYLGPNYMFLNENPSPYNVQILAETSIGVTSMVRCLEAGIGVGGFSYDITSDPIYINDTADVVVGRFTSLEVNNVPVSISGHKHEMSDITDLESLYSTNVVFTTGNQNISGIKTLFDRPVFNSGIQVNNRITSEDGAYIDIYDTIEIRSSETNITYDSSLGEGVNIFDLSTSTSKISISDSIFMAPNVGIGTIPESQLHVIGTGNFTQALQVNGTDVSVSGHSHTSSSITDFGSGVSGLLPSISGTGFVETIFENNVYRIGVTGLQLTGEYVSLTGDESISGNKTFLNDVAVTGQFLSVSGYFQDYLSLNGSGVSITGHSHTVSDITNFNSGVSGIVPAVTGTGSIQVLFNNNIYTINVTGLPLTGHRHPYTDIDSFCTGVADCVNTPLLAGTGIILSYVNGTGLYINASNTGVGINISSSSSGFVVKTGINNYTTRYISNGNNINISYADGVSGNPIIGLSGNLNLIQNITSTGNLRANSGIFSSGISVNNTGVVLTNRKITTSSGIGGGSDLINDLTIGLTGLAYNLSNINTNGFIITTGNNEVVTRVISASGTNILIGSGNGLSGNPIIGLNPYTSGLNTIQSSYLYSNSGNFTNSLQVNGTGVSVNGHVHTSSNITDFNSSVSGLLPVKDIIAGSGIQVGAISGAYTITAFGVAASSASSLITKADNKTGSTISKMSVVYINGGHGNRPTIQKSIASTESGSSKTYGITASDINDNETGDIVVFGALIDVNTNQFGASEGSTLYLSPSISGGITAVKPLAPNHMVGVGKIVRNHNTQGIIEVSIQNGFELYELHDVAVTGVTDGQFLQYNSGSELWVPSSSGNFTSLSVNGTGVSISGHTHTVSDITNFNSSVSGLLPTITNSGDNRVLTSTGGSVGVNAESNLTFDGSSLIVSAGGTTSNNGQLYLNGGTSNRIEFNTNGVSDSSLFNRPNGQKIRLYPSRSTATADDFSIGIGGDGLGGGGTPTRFWQTIDSTSSRFQWYAAATNIATLTGSGIFSTTRGLLSENVTASGSFIGGSGTAALPSFEFVNDPDTGLFSPEANTFGISTSGVERLRINNVGNVGIGTSSPNHQLHVIGSGLITNGLNVSGSLSLNGSGVWHSGNFDSSNIVRTTGNQNVSGIKIFNNIAINESAPVFLSSCPFYIKTINNDSISSAMAIGQTGIPISNILDIRNDGNIAIGTVPEEGINGLAGYSSARLHVKGSNNVSSAALKITNSGDSSLFVVRNDGKIHCGGTPVSTIYPQFFIKSPSSSVNDSSIAIENSNFVTIFELKNNSNVLIGGSNAIAGNANSSLGIKATTSNSSAYAIYSVDSNFNQLFSVRNDGRVGIRTNEPSGQFHVIGTGIISSQLGINTNSPTVALDVSGTISANSGNFTQSLQVNGTDVSISGHNHTSSDISNFGSAVSGLLPTIANSGDNRVLTSNGFSVGINAESNFTFNGNLLSVTGSGSFSNNVTASGFVISGGTSSQFLKADGSVDSSTYLTSLSHNHIIADSAGTQQFTFGVNENIRIAGGGSTSISFDSGTRQVTVSSTDTNTTYSAGSGLSLTGTTFSHTDTSSQGSVDNNNGTVIQDVTLDTYGHVTALNSIDLDSRYYTETEVDTALSAKQATLTNPVSGTGLSNHIAYWTSSSGITAGSGQLYWNSTNNRLGIGTESPTSTLQVSGLITSNSGTFGNLLLSNNALSSSTGNIIITPSTSGSLQRDSGGNPRGIYAVDWQGVRSSGTMVAIGSHSVICGGQNNSTVGNRSVVCGGNNNIAGGIASSVGGGNTNVALGVRSTIGGGTINTANAENATIGGGGNNSVSGINATIGGGSFNQAIGNGSTVAGGANNSSAGEGSTVGGGNSNISTALRSTVVGGSNNTAASRYSTVIGGDGAKTTSKYEVAHSAGFFVNAGDAQHTILVAKAVTSGTAPTNLFTESVGDRLIIPADKTTWTFTAKISAYNNTDNLGAGWNIQGCIQRYNNITTLIGTNVVNQWIPTGMSGVAASAIAATANNALTIQVVGLASKDIRWVGAVDIAQVSWGVI